MGRSGLSAATLLSREGAEILVVDDVQKKPPASLPAGIRFKTGNWTENDLTRADLVVLSPGFPVSKLPAALKKNRVPVISEIELAASLITAPVIGITGTNGKSTTTTLVGQVLHHWGLNVFVGGNLGLPLCEAVASNWDFVVAELSSFQLETITQFRPRIAALLNITPDHLDRYVDLAAYQRAKWRIFENQLPQDHAVLNLDDPLTTPPSIQADTIYFSKSPGVLAARGFPGRGVYLEDGVIKTTIWGEPETVCRLDQVHRAVACHVENILAATAITQLCGCSLEGIAQTLRTFTGLPHRMEFVRSLAGVHYLNDSKGTNTGALMRSLEGLNNPVILIAGGRDKAADFSPLRSLIQDKVKHLILIGEAKEKMAACFSGHAAIELLDEDNGMEAMQEAVLRAATVAKEGDTVLLSPGCASFDQFRDYQDRGEVFKKMVNALPEQARGPVS